MFHEPPNLLVDLGPQDARESAFVTTFVQALLDQSGVVLRYRSPYSSGEKEYRCMPRGLLWDRGHWYLVGEVPDDATRGATRLFRADRVLGLHADLVAANAMMPFDVRDLLGRSWLNEAMETWIEVSPVKLRVTRAQAAKLRADWYYRYARFEDAGAEHELAIFGDNRPEVVTELVRWLGPGAELVEPAAWRDLMHSQLEQMLAAYKTAP